MTDETLPATPAEQVQPAEQDAQVAATSTEETAGQTQEQQAEAQEEKAKKEPWFQKRIGELTREKYEARRAAEEAARRAEQYRQYLSQIQQGQQPEQGEQRQLTQAEIDRIADQRATQKLAEQRFNESCNKVYTQGKAEFPDFDQAVANLQMVGANRDFLELATTSDAGAKLLHHLGSDLDEAARILSLPPVQMARELTRLEIKLSQPVAKPVSKAPAPITPIGSSATGEVDPSKVSDAEWYERVYLKNRK